MIREKRRTIYLDKIDKFVSKRALSRNSDNQSEAVTKKRLGSFFLPEAVESTIVTLMNLKKQQQSHHYQTIRMIYR
jgi:hypothetical protein